MRLQLFIRALKGLTPIHLYALRRQENGMVKGFLQAQHFAAGSAVALPLFTKRADEGHCQSLAIPTLHHHQSSFVAVVTVAYKVCCTLLPPL